MTPKPSYAPAVAGIAAALFYVAILVVVGAPAALAAADAPWQFPVALAVNACLIAAPFLFMTRRSLNEAGAPADFASIAGLFVLLVLSVLFTLGLYIGTGFKAFVVAHLVMAIVLAMAWLGLRGTRGLARDLGARQALTQNRRESLVAVLTEMEVIVAGMPGQDAADARQVLSSLREEARLITPMQADRNPNLMARLTGLVEDLRGAINGSPGAAPVAQSVAAMKAAVENLKRASL